MNLTFLILSNDFGSAALLACAVWWSLCNAQTLRLCTQHQVLYPTKRTTSRLGVPSWCCRPTPPTCPEWGWGSTSTASCRSQMVGCHHCDQCQKMVRYKRVNLKDRKRPEMKTFILTIFREAWQPQLWLVQNCLCAKHASCRVSLASSWTNFENGVGQTVNHR